MAGPLLRRPPFPTGWSSLSLSPRNVTLANTLPVGQAFLWHRQPIEEHAGLSTDCFEEFSRAVDDPPRVVCLRQTAKELFFTALYPDEKDAALDNNRNVTREWLKDYFQLERYPRSEQLYEEWRLRNPELFRRIDSYTGAQGIRVLRQDPWECLIAFITSSNNHIPRITSLLHRFCAEFSPPLLTLSNGQGESLPYHLFPRPHVLPQAMAASLRSLGFGYRAGFVEATIARLRELFGSGEGEIESGLRSWREKDPTSAREELLKLKGVGRKVADCVMLMSLDKASVIPIDTHIASIASKMSAFPARLRNKSMSGPVYDEIQDILSALWSPLGGWCQAVLFAADLPTAPPKLIRAVSDNALLATSIPPRSTSVKRRSPIGEIDFPVVGPGVKRTRSTSWLPKDEKA